MVAYGLCTSKALGLSPSRMRKRGKWRKRGMGENVNNLLSFMGEGEDGWLQ